MPDRAPRSLWIETFEGSHPRLAKFLSIRFRLLVPSLTVEVVLRPLSLKAQRSEKNKIHPHFSDIEAKLASRVPVLIVGLRRLEAGNPPDLCFAVTHGLVKLAKPNPLAS